MDVDYKYTVPEAEARERLQALGEYLFNRHGIRVAWSNDQDKATFDGKYLVVRIIGEMTLGNGRVRFRGQDPGMLWRKKATAYLLGKLETYLNPATPLAALPRGPT